MVDENTNVVVLFDPSHHGTTHIMDQILEFQRFDFSPGPRRPILVSESVNTMIRFGTAANDMLTFELHRSGMAPGLKSTHPLTISSCLRIAIPSVQARMQHTRTRRLLLSVIWKNQAQAPLELEADHSCH